MIPKGKKKVISDSGKVYYYRRNYKAEYDDRTARQKENRTVRRKARSLMEKVLGVKALKGKDVDHVRGIGGGNGRSNLRVTSVNFNRGRKNTRWR